ncbi:hypothetical protein MMB17_10370 [Methylobacterium organophilum]|uniref:hypothetical protein n=1 Tax=Methylobacterium organophilum TaxID=410 RepID=UPI001F149620|nr:hypothetical protein [Methylobacterium organophilum]UMY19667.1 hypothetical protein MMB17_10370 [Methylobacterium organophilum]
MAALTAAPVPAASRPSLPASRLARLPALAARALLAGLAALMVYGLALSFAPNAGMVRTSPDPEQTDVKLYTAIAERVAAGEGYYTAALAEQRQRGYPLKPFVTVRLPTLALLQARIGIDAAQRILCGLAALAALAMAFRLFRDLGPGRVLAAAIALTVVGLLPFGVPVFGFWHEAWASVLVVLSLACRSRERWIGSVLIGFVAVAFRELALPYLCVMAFVALVEGNRREALAWIAAILAFAGLLAAHALTLSHLVTAADPASPGWSAAGGWPFVLSMIGACTLLTLAPFPLVALVAPLCLLGWAAWPGGLGLRVALLLGGLSLAFMLIGRPDNFYWGMMLAPLLFTGLAALPFGLRDLVHAARGQAQPRIAA